MFIKIEPADFFMYRVQLIFDLEKPDPEDQEVRDYLIEHELEPKYQGTGDFEGRQSESMLFGGCYLGRHLTYIGDIQRKAVEVELLTAEIELHLNSPSSESLQLSEKKRQAATAALVRDFHQESSFQTNEQGELIAVLDGDAVREAAQALLERAQSA